MTTEFCKAVHKLTGKLVGLWRLARWNHLAFSTPPPAPQFPPLQDPLTGVLQMDARAKAATLQCVFFPELQPANLIDTHNYNYPELVEDISTIAAAELKEAVFNPALDKVLGLNGISHHILQLLYQDTAGYLHNLSNACLQQGHHPPLLQGSNNNCPTQASQTRLQRAEGLVSIHPPQHPWESTGSYHHSEDLLHY